MFDWQTDEEKQDWTPQDDASAGGTETAVSRRRRWLLPLLALLGMALVGGVIGVRTRQQVAAATARVETDVLAAHNLLRQAAQDQDEDLFSTVLSGRDRAWTQTQKALVADELLWDRPAFHLQADLETAAAPLSAEAVTITLSPDLSAAELIASQPYTVRMLDGEEETVVLAQTAVYRRGGRSWLYAPPERDFWGEWQTERGERLTLHFTARDAGIAQRLAQDWDAMLAQVCTELDVTCADDWRMTVRLAFDPQALQAAHDFEALVASGTQLELPTPTLVGLPLDDAGYDALRRGYGAPLATAAIVDLTGYSCCRGRQIFQMLLAYQLNQLAIQPWPTQPIDYAAVQENWLPPRVWDSNWIFGSGQAFSEFAQLQFDTLLRFLQTEDAPEISIASMQRLLPQTASFTEWARENTPLLTTQWRQFVHQQAQPPLPPPPAAWPDAPLRLVCAPDGLLVNGIAYDPAEEAWTEAFTYKFGRSGYFDFQPTGPIDLVMSYENSEESNDTHVMRIEVWRDGVPTGAIEQEAPLSTGYWLSQLDPLGRYGVLALFDWETANTQRETYQLVDFTTCSEDGCETMPAPGPLNWSADGRFTLWMDMSVLDQAGMPVAAQVPLYLGNARGQNAQLIAENGQFPVWLQDGRFAYLTIDETDDSLLPVTIWVGAPGGGEPQPVLTGAELLALLPDGETLSEPGDLTFVLSRGQAVNADHILLQMTVGEEQLQEYYFRFALTDVAATETAVATLERVPPMVELTYPYPPSPDGRWVLLVPRRSSVNTYHIVLLDLATGAQTMLETPLPQFAWSADSRWLAIYNEASVTLLHMESGYRQTVVHDLTNCWQMVWK